MTVRQPMLPKWPAMATARAAPSSGSVAEPSSSSRTSDCAVAVRGHWQARLRHQRKQSDGFQRDCLTASIGPGDDELPPVVFEFEAAGNNHDALRLEIALQQRMPRVLQQQSCVAKTRVGTTRVGTGAFARPAW